MNNNFKILFFLFLIIQLVSADNTLHNHLRKQNTHLRSGKSDPISVFIIGIILITCSIALLWYNERRQAITEYRLDEAKKICTSINCTEINPNTQNQLVHLNGQAQTNTLLTDHIFGLSFPSCMKLERVVEMFQWVEKRRKNDYYYVQEWKSSQESGNTTHSNDINKWIIQNEIQINKEVYLGSYLLSEGLVGQIQNFVDKVESVEMTNTIAQCVAEYYYNKQFIFKQFVVQDNYIYFRQNADITTLNDLRVKFNKISTGPITVVSQQKDNTLQIFCIHDKFDQTIANAEISQDELNQKDCCSRICVQCKSELKPIVEIGWIYPQILNLNQVFSRLQNTNFFYTLALRFGGYIAYFKQDINTSNSISQCVGFQLIFFPFIWLSLWIPFFGIFLEQLSTLLFILFSFIISIPLSIIVISIAWIFYNPRKAIVLLLIACGISVGIFFYMKNKEN